MRSSGHGNLDNISRHLARAFRDVLTLARTHNLSVYDAAYLELAWRRRLPLASLDALLRGAATAMGVPLYAP